MEKVGKEFDKLLEGIVEQHMYKVQSESNGDGNTQDEYKKDLVDVLLEIQKNNIAGISIDGENIKGLILVRVSLSFCLCLCECMNFSFFSVELNHI